MMMGVARTAVTLLLLAGGVGSYTVPLARPHGRVARARAAVAALQPPEPSEPQRKPKSKRDRFELQFT